MSRRIEECGEREPADLQGFQWVVLSPHIEEGEELDGHILPFGDTRIHELHGDCWCEPVDDLSAPDFLWSHNAADGREAYQAGMRKPH
jgi:hypothetical protein